MNKMKSNYSIKEQNHDKSFSRLINFNYFKEVKSLNENL